MLLGVNNEIAIIMVTLGVFILVASAVGCVAAASKNEFATFIVNYDRVMLYSMDLCQ